MPKLSVDIARRDVFNQGFVLMDSITELAGADIATLDKMPLKLCLYHCYADSDSG